MPHAWSVFVDFVIRNWQGFLVAIVCAELAEILRIRSRTLAAIRHLKNKLSERSVARLQKRIAQQENYRDSVKADASSDKALYLDTLRLVLAVLMFMCAGAVVTIFSVLFLPNDPGPLLTATFLFSVGAVVAGYGLRIAGLHTRSQVCELVANLDREIEELKAKLDSRMRRKGPIVA